jgi:hypothetical protein
MPDFSLRRGAAHFGDRCHQAASSVRRKIMLANANSVNVGEQASSVLKSAELMMHRAAIVSV